MEPLREEIEPVVQALGFQVVEVAARRSSSGYEVSLVVYHPDGVSLEDCAAISRTVKPHVEVYLQEDDVSFEVASPGVDRQIRDAAEYTIFQGRGIRVLLEETGQWEGGIIERCSEGFLYLKNNTKYDSIRLGSIRKARLDYTEEVR